MLRRQKELRRSKIIALLGGERLFRCWLEKRKQPKVACLSQIVIITPGNHYLGVQLVNQERAVKGWHNPSGAGQEDREQAETFGPSVILDKGGCAAPHSSPLLPALFFLYSLRLSLLPVACRTLLLPFTRGMRRKECHASTSLIPSLAFHRPLLTPCRRGLTFLRTQRGCGPGPGTIVKTSLSTFDPFSLSSPSDPWLYHNFMVLSCCPGASQFGLTPH